ncbi:putative arsenical pump-driving ATPase [Tetrabaena socialis]|uniref:Putative arsenical pump-driving ATPase n=1 Tax=Tetrabaena socialis TaxID=47790 RepID=A0A2J8A6T7_9CHLO|nr:putative arsenical pump-driving ATPase [Tetrabaena socialis]|eukprot:PNH08215.1 putative arsenical pump-driving ATPase [Tetrabaena socialis]
MAGSWIRGSQPVPCPGYGPSTSYASAPRGPAPRGAAGGATAVTVGEGAACFEELAAGQQRKYIMISGKGGVGKTSLSASLAVKLAAAGHTTLVVSTDPAHSLSDSLAQASSKWGRHRTSTAAGARAGRWRGAQQLVPASGGCLGAPEGQMGGCTADVSGGRPVLLQGTDLPLWGLEIDAEEAKREFMGGGGTGADGEPAGPSAAAQVGDFMNKMGMGFITDQLKELKLGELLDTPPPGLDEAVAVAKVVQFVQSAEYARFSRIVFDTAPTGHTLRLLTLPDFVDASLGKHAHQITRYFLLGGKGGVGKTSCSSSLAVRFASEGLPTLVVSTDPAHSLSDAFDQDLSGGEPVRVTSPLGDELPLWGLQLDPEQAKAELREVLADDGGKKLNDDLRLGELLDTPPPGVDEAIAIAKVVQFLKAPEYAHFKRIIFDTAPTGHTLRLLSLPDFIDASIGKLVRLRQKLSSATGAVKSFFSGGKPVEEDPAVVRLEQLQARMEDAKALFRNQETTEFVIVTIPTVMATAESIRLAGALQHEGIPLKTIIVNQPQQPAVIVNQVVARYFGNGRRSVVWR